MAQPVGGASAESGRDANAARTFLPRGADTGQPPFVLCVCGGGGGTWWRVHARVGMYLTSKLKTSRI